MSIPLFDKNASLKKVTSHFYNMCLTKGADGAKAKIIFEVIDYHFKNDDTNDCLMMTAKLSWFVKIIQLNLVSYKKKAVMF